MGALVTALVLLVAACGEDESDVRPGDTVAGRVPDANETTTDPEGSATSEEPTPESTAGGGTDPASLADTDVELVEVADLDDPVKLVGRPGDERLFVGLKAGEVVALDPDGQGAPETVLDVSAETTDQGEQGLLGLAFSTDGATLYVHHSGLDGETRIVAFPMGDDGADPDAATELLIVDQPYPNHNGGDIVVTPDDALWIGLGDGGSAGDPEARAQDPDELLGKVLRIDPTTSADGRPYAIPGDNPYADGGGRPEIAIVGVRNPWRLRFDAETGDLWVADVGQAAWEEITRLPAEEVLGANLGWSRLEGSTTFDATRELGDGTVVGPAFEMSHDDGWCSVTGGPVLRDARLPSLAGAYLFGDYCKPGLNALRVDAAGQVTETLVLDEGLSSTVSIDTDLEGRAYVVSLDGTVARIDPA